MHSDRVSTTGSESRKSSKPIMEKRRRARINASLAELKTLLLDVIKKEGARHSKMEKADILEMAVKHLRQIQRQHYTGNGADPTLSDKYRLGFNECAQEVSRYLGASDDDDAELRARLLNHLANCISSADSPSPNSTPSTSPAPQHTSGAASPSSGGSVTVTPLTPIHVRSAVKTTTAAFSVSPQNGGVGGGLPSSAALLVPVSEINNNVVSMANNNLVGVSSIASGSDANSGHVTLTSASQGLHVSHAAKVLGELQMMQPKPGNGEVAFVFPANLNGGHLPSYIIPVYTSHPSLPASVSLAPNTSAQSALPVQLPIMASPQVSVAAGAPSLVTLTSGSGMFPPVSVTTGVLPSVNMTAGVLPPASVGHLVGLNGSLSWPHTTHTVYSTPSNYAQTTVASLVFSSPSSSSPTATITSTSNMTPKTSPEKAVSVQHPIRDRSPVSTPQQKIAFTRPSPPMEVTQPDIYRHVDQRVARVPVDRPMLQDQGNDVWRPW